MLSARKWSYLQLGSRRHFSLAPLSIPDLALKREKRSSSVGESPSMEDSLIARTDPYAVLNNHVNPYVMRSFRQTLEMDSTNGDYKHLLKLTQQSLFIWKKKLVKTTQRYWNERTIDINSEHVEQQAHQCLSSVIETARKNFELKGLTTFMSLLLPRNTYIWRAYDRLMLSKLSVNTLEMNLLAAYSIDLACRKLYFKRSAFRFPSALVEKYLDEMNKMANSSNPNQSKNIFSVGLPIEPSADMFSPIGSSQVRDNIALELLGLQIHLLALNKFNFNFEDSTSTSNSSSSNDDNPNVPTYQLMEVPFDKQKMKKLLANFSEHIQHTLSAVSSPVKMNTLCELWQNIHQLDLPNSYGVYASLYHLVFQSLTADPLQIINEEDMVCSLLESMVASKHKSSKLINLIFNIVSTRGMQFSHYSLRLFNTLAELNAVSFSAHILEQVLHTLSGGSGLSLFKDKHGFNIILSDTTKESMFRYISSEDRDSQTKLSSSRDTDFLSNESPSHLVKPPLMTKLILALLFFNNEERTSPHRALIARLEVEFINKKQYTELSIKDLVNLYYIYGFAGRMNVNLLTKLDELLAQAINDGKLTNKNLSTIIWCCGRLDHHPQHLHRCREMYFEQLENISALSTSGVTILCRTLWALAVLQDLSAEDFLRVSGRLLSLKSKQSHLHKSWLVRQFLQIRNEFFVLRQRLEANGGTREEKVNCEEAIKVISDFLITHRKIRISNAALALNVTSPSYTHQDASRMLTILGVAHENEKLLENGYMVDIFIPNQGDSNKKGTVLEFDGPYHFDSYLSRPLGPTSMKRRQIESCGYTMISINYWDYKIGMTKKQKLAVIKQSLRQANVPYIEDGKE